MSEENQVRVALSGIAERDEDQEAAVPTKIVYMNKHREVNLKKEKRAFKFDPFLPFQNVKLTNDYYILPT